MRDDLYARAQAIAHEVLELPLHEREACLDARCAECADLRREVEWLIAASGDPSLDDTPAAVVEAIDALEADLRIESSVPGRYRLLERLGEGGMGVVWLAERVVGGVRQRVALKRLYAGSVAQQARFREEQRILAALNHPNIAHLIDAGTGDDGTPFLAMEYIEGERIDRWCDAQGLSVRARVELFIKVCAAVSYAHERLVIHRDLKPANILVDASGEPKLLDFGIARLADADAAPTLTARMMTPAYASPEQIGGAPLGTATDVWSLGVVLYELVAGVRPFEHVTTDHARLRAILAAEVAPPSQRQRRVAMQADGRGSPEAAIRSNGVPSDIDAIVLKALRRSPEQRYASVRELADDLKNFLETRPVSARRGQRAYRAQRFVQRYRWQFAVVATGIAVATGFTWKTVLAEREARLQAQVAERTTEFLISAFALSDPTRAGRHDFSAREVLDRGRARVDEELADQPRVRARLLDALGDAYRGINEGTAGAPLLEEAARLYLDPEVNAPLAAARSLRLQALSILAARGSSEAAESAAQRALDLVVQYANGDTLLLAETYGTLARALDTSGKEALAQSAAQQAVALLEAGHAPPLEMARGLYELCVVTAGRGGYAEALAHCERARLLYLEAGAVQTNDYRMALRHIELTLSYLGEHARSLAVSRERIALTQSLFGEDSAELAMDRVNIAGMFAERGLFDEAAASVAAGMPVVLRRNGPRSTQYAMAVFNAGWLKYQLGEFDAAAESLREALNIYTAAVDGRDNHRLQVLRVTLSMALIDAGRKGSEARELLEAVIEARSAAQTDTVGLAYARLPLAHWYVLRGEYAEADVLLDQVEAVGDGVEAELHARAAATRAASLHARGDLEQALQHAQSAYEITLRDDGALNPRTARYALSYARKLRAAGDAGAAQRLEHEFRPVLESSYPSGSAFRRALLDT